MEMKVRSFLQDSAASESTRRPNEWWFRIHHRGLTWIPNKDDLEEDFPFKLGGLDGIHVDFWVYISYCWNQWMSWKPSLNTLVCQDSHAEASLRSLTPVAQIVVTWLVWITKRSWCIVVSTSSRRHRCEVPGGEPLVEFKDVTIELPRCSDCCTNGVTCYSYMWRHKSIFTIYPRPVKGALKRCRVSRGCIQVFDTCMAFEVWPSSCIWQVQLDCSGRRKVDRRWRKWHWKDNIVWSHHRRKCAGLHAEFAFIWSTEG